MCINYRKVTQLLRNCRLSILFCSLLFQYLHMFINEVTALVPVLRDCNYTFAVYTAHRIKQRWPLVLAAQTEKDMNDWVKITL